MVRTNTEISKVISKPPRTAGKPNLLKYAGEQGIQQMCALMNEVVGGKRSQNNDNQSGEMEQVRFRGKIHIIRKSAERVDGGMDEDAGEQAAAAVKDRDQQKTDRDGKNDLAQVIDQSHTAAVEQVDDMSDAESHTGDNNGGFDIILCNGLKQQTPEDHFLQETNT